MLLVTSPEASLDGRGVSWVPPLTRWQEVLQSPSAAGGPVRPVGQCGRWASAGEEQTPRSSYFALIILTNVRFSALVLLFR